MGDHTDLVLPVLLGPVPSHVLFCFYIPYIGFYVLNITSLVFFLFSTAGDSKIVIFGMFGLGYGVKLIDISVQSIIIVLLNQKKNQGLLIHCIYIYM